MRKVERPKIKICSKCGEYKLVEEFSLDSRSKSGLQTKCKDCEKKYRDNNKEKREEYLDNTKEQRSEKMRDYYIKNKEAINRWRRNYYSGEGKLSILAANWERRIKKISSSDGSVTKQFLQDLFVIQKGKCNICDKTLEKFHIDHIIPLSKRGKHRAENIQLLCDKCNLKKSNKIVEDLVFRDNVKYNPEVVISILLKEMKLGKSIEQVCVSLGIAKSTFYEWLKKYDELSNAKKRGEELSYSWWLEKGRDNLENRQFNPTLFYMNMKNRFGWADKTEITGANGKDLIPTEEKKKTIGDRLKDLL